MGAGIPALGVKFDDESRKVVNVLDQEDILSQLDVIHQWYKDGIINADAPAVGEVPSYRMFFAAQGWSGAAKTTWGPNMGAEAVTTKFIDTIVSNNTVRGSLNAVSANSKNPEKALQFLQLLNLDSKVRDAFYYGLEGENFKYTADGEVEKLNNEWEMAGYTQGTFFNVTKLATDEFNQWDEVKELNANAKPSVLLGFNLDTSKIESELANCRSVYEKYRSELMTGAKEPRELIKQIDSELDAAGFQTIITEAQSQIDAMYNK
jgi:putative aldouronate transport system substrate-binding protein